MPALSDRLQELRLLRGGRAGTSVLANPTSGEVAFLDGAFVMEWDEDDGVGVFEADLCRGW